MSKYGSNNTTVIVLGGLSYMESWTYDRNNRHWNTTLKAKGWDKDWVHMQFAKSDKSLFVGHIQNPYKLVRKWKPDFKIWAKK